MDKKQIKQLEDLIWATQEEFNIPGLSIAVGRGDKLLYSRGL